MYRISGQRVVASAAPVDGGLIMRVNARGIATVFVALAAVTVGADTPRRITNPKQPSRGR